MLRSIAGNDSASKRRIALNGLDLSLAEFIAIARFGATCEPSRSCEEQVVENHRVVQAKISELTKGEDGPRNDPAAAQQALTGFLCGIMPGESTQNSSGDTSHNATKSQLSNGSTADFASTVAQAHTLPPAWVRAAMLLKMNSLLRAKSGLPWEVIETLARMLSDELTPMVPSQGSISANGDTSPLSYVALAMTGNSRVSVANIAALELSSQELQCLTTGTSLSCAVAAHSLADVHTLMLLAQLVIAANAEVVMASRKPYDTLVSDQSRPHSGQIEIAANLRSFLSGSHFTHLDDDSPFSALAHCLQLALQLSAQDAASLAKIGEDLFPNQHLSVSSSSSLQTAPQWLGPPLEDLLHAHRNLSTEMNSCTETPVMDPGAARLLSSGNSQAMTVSNASEKIRDVAAHIGRILHALHEEITSSSSPSGLPANLSLAEPSIEVGFKGVSIGCAALASELGFQATRSGHFAQSAGSDNANLGSLALLSSRSTASSVETLTKLVCNAMLMVCQALDVRTCLIAHLRLFATELSLLIGLSDDVFKAYASNDVRSQINRASSDSNVSEEKAVRRQMLHKLTAVVALALMRHPSLDSTERANIAAQHGARAMLEFDLDLELEEGKRSEESSRQAEVPAPSSRKQDVLDPRAEWSRWSKNLSRPTTETRTGRTVTLPTPEAQRIPPSQARVTAVLIQVLEPVLAHIIQRTFERSRDAYFQASRQSPDAEDELANQVRQTPNRKRAPTDYSREGKLPTSPLPFLGTGTTALYRFVRIQLGLKMHRSAALDQPSHVSSAAPASRSADDEGSSAAETGSQHRPSQGVPSQGRHAHGSSQGRQQAAAENHSTSRSKNKKRPTTGESSRGNANGNGRRNVNHNSKKDNAHVRGRNGEQAHRGTTATQGQGDEDAPIRTLGDELSLLYEAVRSPQVILDAFDRVLPLP
ncbi:hypothetical protein V8E36_004664 [Tilletia maclaganii]